MDSILALEDGRLFRGRGFGAHGERTGEVVFNTSMTGYQEILTDPSYAGQLVVMTYPQIGNVGVNRLDRESARPQVEGFVVRELSPLASNWRAVQALDDYLREHGIPAISGIDTRALTRHIRSCGAMKGVLSSIDRDESSLVRKAREAPGLESQDLVGRVTCSAPYGWHEPRETRWATPLPGRAAADRPLCVAYDFGAKYNIFRLLWESGFNVEVVPVTTPAADTLARRPRAVFLSNGPGDPAAAGHGVEVIRGLLGKLPMFGICLGHQLAGLALGAKTFKLKFGHRGANHPVKDLRSGRVAVTSQNHGYAVDPDTLPASVEVTHISLNDHTCEGFIHHDARLIAVQYHPESSPGPHDSLDLFHQFVSMTAGPPATDRTTVEER